MKTAMGFSVIVFFAIPISLIAVGLAEETSNETFQQVEQVSAPEGSSGLVAMNFEEADIQDVIKVIAMASGLNMVIGKDVQAKVTISLKNMPWEKALDVILRTYNFTYKKEEGLIRIMTFEKVKQEERDIPLVTKIIYLNFAKVDDMKTTLSKSLSSRGTIEGDVRTSSLVITDVPAKIEEIEQIARTLDTRTPQVMIEAMLVDVKITKDDELGINWKIIHADRQYSWQDKETSNNYIEQPSALSSLSGTAVKVGWLQRMGSFRLDGLIQAWVQSDKAKILASPKVLTLDNKEARIEIILQIPYIAEMSEQGNVSYSFKEVGTKLHVTPQITSGGFVSMELEPELSYQSGTTGDGQPIIDTRTAKINVLVEDGETIVIGGMRRIDDTRTYTKIPVLGDIPFLGTLFRKKDLNKIDTELLMFVTPHVVVKPHITKEEHDKYKMLDELTRSAENKAERKRSALLPAAELELPQPTPSWEEEIPPLPAKKDETEIKQDLGDEDYIYVW